MDTFAHGPSDIEERGGDSTVEVLGLINSLTESEGTASILHLRTDTDTASLPQLQKVDLFQCTITISLSFLLTVESCKKALTKDPKIASSVDWLTEVIRRYSDAALAARPFTTVNMKHLARLEKVSLCSSAIFIETTAESDDYDSGRSTRLQSSTSHSRMKKSWLSRMLSPCTGPSCVQ